MPIYEYECESCGHRFDVMQRISAEPVKACERCGRRVHRLFSPPAIIFKGSGFYCTDYGRSSSRPSGEPRNSDSKADGKPDAKPESKPESKSDGKSESRSDAKVSPAPASGGKADAKGS